VNKKEAIEKTQNLFSADIIQVSQFGASKDVCLWVKPSAYFKFLSELSELSFKRIVAFTDVILDRTLIVTAFLENASYEAILVRASFEDESTFEKFIENNKVEDLNKKLNFIKDSFRKFLKQSNDEKET